MKRLLSIVALLSLGVIAGVLLDRFLSTSQNETAIEHAVKHQDPGYICPMHSEIVSHEESSCPICGMDLVPIKLSESLQEDDDPEHPVVRISSTVINNLGVRVAQVERGTLVRQIETPGYVQTIRKERHSRVVTLAKGKIEKFHFKFGQWMKKGDALIDIALDDLVKMQEKHLVLLVEEKEAGKELVETVSENLIDGKDKVDVAETKNTENEKDSVIKKIEQSKEDVSEEIKPEQKTTTKMTSENTRYLMTRVGMTKKQIKHLEDTGETSSVITLYASHAGTPLDLKLNVGDEVKANGFLFTLGNLMRVTVLANAFQRDAGAIQPGQEVDIVIPGEGGDPIKGRVSQGAVSINNTSQNIGVKLVFSARKSLVKSGMYVIGRVYARHRENTLSLPREAIIYTEKEQRVIEALGNGRFKPVVVKTGISTSDRVEILEGLEEGDTIVVSAQFLIDSESSLQSSYRRMTAVE